MPQLDIYTYFTQFQWLLVIFTLLFIIINGKYISSFQYLIFSRNYLLNSSEKNHESNPTQLKGFDLKLTSFTSKNRSHSAVNKWEKIFARNKSNKKKSK